MKKIRVEIHLTEEEVKKLDVIAKSDGKSRKNFCETSIKKIIDVYHFNINLNK